MDEFFWWNETVDHVLERLETRSDGLTDVEAESRRSNRPDSLLRAAHDSDWLLLISQLKSPITLLLIGTVLLSWLPLTRWLGFVTLPVSFAGSLVLIVLAYMASAELTKRWYHSKVGRTMLIEETASQA